ncbi:MAG TPA: glycosyltransferase family 9 protein [Vicinamibacterales bacterium]|nr:glycosyltransferase family 9 protein [Vicinamibacterales bacterium]
MRILLVRPRLIGDVILTTPAIRAIRRRFPDAEILYLVESLAAPVVASNPHLTDVLVVEYRRGWDRFRDDVRMARALRARRIDVAIDFHGGPRSAWLTWASRARVRVGYDIRGRMWMYTRVVRRPRGAGPRHSMLNQWDLLAAVDPALAAPPTPEADRVEMPVDASARASVDRRLAALGVGRGDRVVVLHVSARNPFRRWPETAFAQVAAGLVRGQRDRWVVVVGGPSDRDAAGRVMTEAHGLAGADAARIVPGEGWSLAEMRAVMDRAALFLGGDSGPMHIAATSDVPIVALYGPTVPDQWKPWRPTALRTVAVDAGPLPCRPCDQRSCIPGDFRCLMRITPESVLVAATGVLESTMTSRESARAH